MGRGVVGVVGVVIVVGVGSCTRGMNFTPRDARTIHSCARRGGRRARRRGDGLLAADARRAHQHLAARGRTSAAVAGRARRPVARCRLFACTLRPSAAQRRRTFARQRDGRVWRNCAGVGAGARPRVAQRAAPPRVAGACRVFSRSTADATLSRRGPRARAAGGPRVPGRRRALRARGGAVVRARGEASRREPAHGRRPLCAVGDEHRRRRPASHATARISARRGRPVDGGQRPRRHRGERRRRWVGGRGDRARAAADGGGQY